MEIIEDQYIKNFVHGIFEMLAECAGLGIVGLYDGLLKAEWKAERIATSDVVIKTRIKTLNEHQTTFSFIIVDQFKICWTFSNDLCNDNKYIINDINISYPCGISCSAFGLARDIISQSINSYFI